MSNSETAEAPAPDDELYGPASPQELAFSKTEQDAEALYFNWHKWALDKQRPPAGDWTTWLLLGGRGAGKTRAGAEWVRGLAARGVSPIALVGETMTEAASIMVRGDSGILGVHPDKERPRLKDNELYWPNGVRDMVMSASDPDRFRGPQFAAAWCDELGSGAVDKGANQPNIFGDDKSAESGGPHFSTGMADPLMQRQALRAHQAFWRDPANNPPGMVDIDRIYHWTWDARPWPAFPALTEVWSDGANHRTGHWLTGRLGGLSSDELAVALAAEHGVTLTAEASLPFVSGYTLGTATTGRAALEPLIAVTGQGLRHGPDGLHLGAASRQAAVTLEPALLAQGEGATLSRRRGDPAEKPGRLALSFVDRERDYLTGTVTALAQADGPLAGESMALVLDGAAARLAAERLLDGQSARRETLEFELPPAQLALEPGDVVAIAGLAEGPFEITAINDRLTRKVTVQALPALAAVAVGGDRSLRGGSDNAVRAVPLLALAQLPPLPAEPTRARLALAGYAQPWPGALQLVDETTGTSLASLARRGELGVLATPLAAGPRAVWDRGPGVEVTLHEGHLASAEDLAVLAGSNRLAVQTDVGAWEVIGFAAASLVAPGRYRLTGLLRGLESTGPAIGPAAIGARVIILDSRVATLPIETAWLGETRALRLYAGSGDVEGTPLTLAVDLGPALPLPPVHLRARRQPDGDIVLTWTRCSRADGDGWGLADAPLEHAPEAYRLTILDGGVVRRVIDVGSPTALYSSAEQLLDFGGLPGAFSFSVAQLSPVLGAGHAASGDFHG
ncbi:baseplate megatron protein TIM-barrel domain-containing protein [Devosia beringensis]|uniref:baseplate megatron protein TIM-barrel domain-containing protein n=1 Tax=Devosia beringensis TaxID=2657486 RepID=UPI00186B9FA2|nr:glycoside hydrolase TIM-barrel-like domain-containing protein [Devosia beringensis]